MKKHIFINFRQNILRVEYLKKFNFFTSNCIFLGPMRRTIIILSRTRKAILEGAFGYFQHLHTTHEKIFRVTFTNFFNRENTLSSMYSESWISQKFNFLTFSFIFLYLLVILEFISCIVWRCWRHLKVPSNIPLRIRGKMIVRRIGVIGPRNMKLEVQKLNFLRYSTLRIFWRKCMKTYFFKWKIC